MVEYFRLLVIDYDSNRLLSTVAVITLVTKILSKYKVLRVNWLQFFPLRFQLNLKKIHQGIFTKFRHKGSGFLFYVGGKHRRTDMTKLVVIFFFLICEWFQIWLGHFLIWMTKEQSYTKWRTEETQNRCRHITFLILIEVAIAFVCHPRRQWKEGGGTLILILRTQLRGKNHKTHTHINTLWTALTF